MHETRLSKPGSGTTQWDGMGREWGGAFGTQGNMDTYG